MPAEAELTSAQIKELFDLLLNKREILESQLSESRDALKPVALDQTLQGGLQEWICSNKESPLRPTNTHRPLCKKGECAKAL